MEKREGTAMKQWKPVKKLLLLLLAAGLTATLSVSNSLALFTATPPQAANSVTIDRVIIGIDEGDWADGPTVTPGVPVKKEPKVENTSPFPVWVRVTAAGLKNFEPEGLGAGGLWQEFPEGSGVWYYTVPLEPGDSTEPLFTAVKLKKDFYGDASELNIVIYAEAVQMWVNYPKDSSDFAKTAKEAFWVLDGNEGKIPQTP